MLFFLFRMCLRLKTMSFTWRIQIHWYLSLDIYFPPFLWPHNSSCAHRNYTSSNNRLWMVALMRVLSSVPLDLECLIISTNTHQRRQLSTTAKKQKKIDKYRHRIDVSTFRRNIAHLRRIPIENSQLTDPALLWPYLIFAIQSGQEMQRCRLRLNILEQCEFEECT